MPVRILPGQPSILTFCQAPEETRNKAGNPGFSRINFRLQTPDSQILGRQSAKVSGHLYEYSRSAETNAGDRVRSALRGLPGSCFGRLLEPFVREIGNFHGALRDEAGRIISWRALGFWAATQGAGPCCTRDQTSCRLTTNRQTS